MVDNFQQPTESANEKCQRLKSMVHYEPRNYQRKSVKSFAGHLNDHHWFLQGKKQSLKKPLKFEIILVTDSLNHWHWYNWVQ